MTCREKLREAQNNNLEKLLLIDDTPEFQSNPSRVRSIYQLIKDVVTRWNYTCNMAERFLRLRQFVTEVINKTKERKKAYSKYILISDEVLLVEQMLLVLEPIREITIMISDSGSTNSLIISALSNDFTPSSEMISSMIL